MTSLRRVLVSTVPRILGSNGTAAVASYTLHRPIRSFSRSYYSNQSNQSVDIDLSNDESKRRLFNRLLYRSRKRSYLELDLVLGKWVDDHIHSMDETRVKSLVHVLDLLNKYNDSISNDMSRFSVTVRVGKSRSMEMVDLSGATPEEVNLNPVFVALREKVVNNLDNFAAPETRATLGQSWVRGWDDFKKGREGPITGNQ